MSSIETALEGVLIQAAAAVSEAAVLFRVDLDTLRVVHVNDKLIRIVPGLASAVGLGWEAVVHGSSMTSHLEVIRSALNEAMNSKLAVNIRLPFGTQAFDLRLQPFQTETGATCHVLCTLPAKWSVQAANEETSLDDRLQISELAYQRLVEACPITIVVHQDWHILYVNPSGIAMLQARSFLELENLSVFDFLPSAIHPALAARMQKLNGGETLPPMKAQVIRENNDVIDVEIRSMPIIHDGRPAVLSLIQDISEHQQMIDTLERLAFFDPLTELPNRRLIQERTATALSSATLASQQLVVLFIDFDGFKEINDLFGHETGDTALRQMASRLQTCLDPSRDMLGRLAGDEFIITRINADKKDTEELAVRLLHAFRAPIVVEDEQVPLELSIGIAMFPRDADNYDLLLRQADAAMYIAKQNGGNAFAWFQ